MSLNISQCICHLNNAWESVQKSTLVKDSTKYRNYYLVHSFIESETKEKEVFVPNLAKSVVIRENVEDNISEWMDCIINELGFKYTTDEHIIKRL